MNDRGYDDRPATGLTVAELLEQALQSGFDSGYYPGSIPAASWQEYEPLLTTARDRRNECFAELRRRLEAYRKMADACRKLLHYRERNTLNFQLCKADDFHRLIGLALDELEAKGNE